MARARRRRAWVVITLLAALLAGANGLAAAAPRPAVGRMFLGGGVLVSPDRYRQTHVEFRIPRIGCARHKHAVIRIGLFGVQRRTNPHSGAVTTKRWFAGARITCYRKRLSKYAVAYNAAWMPGPPAAPRDRIDVWFHGRACGGVSVEDHFTGTGLDTACTSGAGRRLLIGARIAGAAPRPVTVTMDASVNGKPPAASGYELHPQIRGKMSLVIARRPHAHSDAVTVALT